MLARLLPPPRLALRPLLFQLVREPLVIRMITRELKTTAGREEEEEGVQQSWEKERYGQYALINPPAY